MDLYAENILDHFRHPRGKTAVDRPSISHKEVNISCGDAVTVSLAILADRITAIGWEGTGCAISQAAMSMIAEDLAGKSLVEVEAMTPKDMYDFLGVPIGPRRTKCALLCLHALKNAVRKFRGEDLKGWNETIGGHS